MKYLGKLMSNTVKSLVSILLFLAGFSIGLFIGVFLVSDISSKMLLLFSVTLAGSFGGLLYALRDNSQKDLVLPQIHSGSFSLGLLADCAYGLAGAYVIFLIIPGTFNFETGEEIIKVLGMSIVGGYGGRIVVERVLSEFLQKRLEEAEKKIDIIETQTQHDAKALELLSLQFDSEVPAVSDEELKEAIKCASNITRTNIFLEAQKLRHNNWNKNKLLMEKTIPVFEALIESDTENKFHRNYAQLGYALRDKDGPDHERAQKELTEAIRIRDSQGQKGFLFYEFIRAICNIELDGNYKQCNSSPKDVCDKIMKDLRVVAQDSDKKKIIKYSKSIRKWLKCNNLSLWPYRRK